MFQDTKGDRPEHYHEHDREMEINPNMDHREPHPPEDVNNKLESARVQAAFYESQRKQWEEERAELEEINSQRTLCQANINAIGMRMQNAKRRITKEMDSMEAEFQELSRIQQCLEQHIDVLSPLNANNWGNEGLQNRIREAMIIIDRAENDINEIYYSGKKMRHTDVFFCKPGEEDSNAPLSWSLLSGELLRGFFFHIPLILLIFLFWLTWLLFT